MSPKTAERAVCGAEGRVSRVVLRAVMEECHTIVSSDVRCDATDPRHKEHEAPLADVGLRFTWPREGP